MASNPFSGNSVGGYGSFAQPSPYAWAQPQNALTGIGSALGRNSNLLLGLGAGLLSGNLGNVPQAISAGSQADRAQTLQGYQLSLAMAGRKAADDYVTKLGHPELKGAFATVGDAVSANKPTIVPLGSSATSGFGDPMKGSGGFDGSKSGAVNYLYRAQSDPSLKNSDAYAAAWAVATEPTSTPQGMITPQFPSQWAPSAPAPLTPQSMNSPPPQSSGGGYGSQGMGSDVAPIGSMANTQQGGGFQSIAGPAPVGIAPGIIPGSEPFNESRARTTMLTQSAIPDLKRVVDGFPSLVNLKDQLLQKMPGDLGRVLQDPAYKQSHDAITAAISNVLYVASGANLNSGELQRKVEAYTPAVGDDAQTAANKLDRFSNDIVVLANATKDPATIQWAQQAIAGLAATKEKLLNSGSSAQPLTGKTSTGVPWSVN